MKKIVLFTSTLNIGGIERVFLTYAGLLAGRGYDVTYLVCYDNGDFLSKIPSGVSLCNLSTNKLRKSLFALVKFIRKKQPDAILVANSATIIVYIAKLLSGSNTKVITSHHNYLNVDVSSILDTKIIWKFYNRCDAVIAISKGIYTHLLEHHVSKNKLKLVYNPVNISEITVLSKEKAALYAEQYILFVGRLSKVKNIGMALRSFKLFYENNPSFSFFIIGDGPEKTYLQNLVEKMNLSNSVRFVGCVSNPYPYIYSSSLVVLSSLSEAFPTILLESLALGKTVVSTPTQGAREILDEGKLGYIVNSFEDPHEFAKMIGFAIKEPFNENILKDTVRNQYDGAISIKVLETLWN